MSNIRLFPANTSQDVRNVVAPGIVPDGEEIKKIVYKKGNISDTVWRKNYTYSITADDHVVNPQVVENWPTIGIQQTHSLGTFTVPYETTLKISASPSFGYKWSTHITEQQITGASQLISLTTAPKIYNINFAYDEDPSEQGSSIVYSATVAYDHAIDSRDFELAKDAIYPGSSNSYGKQSIKSFKEESSETFVNANTIWNINNIPSMTNTEYQGFRLRPTYTWHFKTYNVHINAPTSPIASYCYSTAQGSCTQSLIDKGYIGWSTTSSTNISMVTDTNIVASSLINVTSHALHGSGYHDTFATTITSSLNNNMTIDPPPVIINTYSVNIVAGTGVSTVQGYEQTRDYVLVHNVHYGDTVSVNVYYRDGYTGDNVVTYTVPGNQNHNTSYTFTVAGRKLSIYEATLNTDYFGELTIKEIDSDTENAKALQIEAQRNPSFVVLSEGSLNDAYSESAFGWVELPNNQPQRLCLYLYDENWYDWWDSLGHGHSFGSNTGGRFPDPNNISPVEEWDFENGVWTKYETD